MMTLNWGTKKVQTVGTISQFMSKQTEVQAEPKVKKPMTRLQTATVMTANLTAVGLTTALFGASTPVFAAEAVPVSKQTIANSVMHGFQPLIDLVMGLSYPASFAAIAYGGIMFLVNREKALKYIQGGAISFFLVQLTPMIMKILVGIGTGF